jgi:hypothetical protein
VLRTPFYLGKEHSKGAEDRMGLILHYGTIGATLQSRIEQEGSGEKVESSTVRQL